MGVLYRVVRWERYRQNESVSKQAAKAIHNGTEVKETNLFEFCCCCGLSPERKEIVSRRSGGGFKTASYGNSMLLVTLKHIGLML